MFDTMLRPLKEDVLTPIAQVMGRRVPATAISVVAVLAGLASAGAILAHRLDWALVLWWVNRVLDGLDGTHARVHGQASSFGGYLDIVFDFIVYAAVPIALVASSSNPRLARAGALLLGSFFVNAASWMYLAALLEQRHAGAQARGELTSITMPPGFVAGTETVLFYSLFLLWPSRQVELFWTMTVLVAANVVARLYWAWRHLDAPGSSASS